LIANSIFNIPDIFRHKKSVISAESIEKVRILADWEKDIDNRENINKGFNYEAVCQEIFNYFLGKFNEKFNVKRDIKFGHGYYRKLEIKRDNNNIFIDDTLLSALFQFIAAVFYWAEGFGDKTVALFGFRYLLFITNDLCLNLHELPGTKTYEEFMDRFNGKLNILMLASNVYWVMVIFAVLHELSHIFLEHKPHKEIHEKEEFLKQEYDADELAYVMLLDTICNRNNILSNYNIMEIFEEYTYLAPMMLIDFYDLPYYVDSIINKTKFYSLYPSPVHRKERLFKVFDDWEKSINTEEGNDLYNYFVDVIEKFKNDVCDAEECGNLNVLKRKWGYPETPVSG
jgi:hypothetical protein